MTVKITRLSEENTSLLENVADGVFDHPVRPDCLKAFVNDPRHVMFLAVDEGVVVGMASGVEYFHPDKPPQFWINEVGVCPGKRNRGAGRALTQRLVREAQDRGCIYAWLGTASDNLPAQACFGSVPKGEKPQPFLLYEWDLED